MGSTENYDCINCRCAVLNTILIPKRAKGKSFDPSAYF